MLSRDALSRFSYGFDGNLRLRTWEFRNGGES